MFVATVLGTVPVPLRPLCMVSEPVRSPRSAPLSLRSLGMVLVPVRFLGPVPKPLRSLYTIDIPLRSPEYDLFTLRYFARYRCYCCLWARHQ